MAITAAENEVRFLGWSQYRMSEIDRLLDEEEPMSIRKAKILILWRIAKHTARRVMRVLGRWPDYDLN